MCSRATSLQIVQTSLTSLDLDSLRQIRGGNVLVQQNAELCYARYIDWRSLLGDSAGFSVTNNRNPTLCGSYKIILLITLHASETVAQCIVIGPVCGFVCGFV